jgi:predicted DNA-binding protein
MTIRNRNVVRHHPYLRAEESKRLVELCARTNTTESAIIREALHRYWSDAPTDATLIMGRLDRAQRAHARTQRDVELLTEAFAIFVRFWFAHTPAVASDARKTARSASTARYKEFVDYVATQFGAGRRFVDDLPRDVVADPAELAVLAATAATASSAAAPEPSPTTNEGTLSNAS